MKKLCALLLLALLVLTQAASAEPVTVLHDGDKIDLDGDGAQESITFACTEDDDETGEPGSYTLSVNDQIVRGEGCMLTGALGAARLNEHDGVAYLFVEEAGMSDDYAVYVYRWDGEKLFSLGVIGSALDSLDISRGMITGVVRASTLATWFHEEDYTIAHTYIYDEDAENWKDEPMLCKVPRYLYPVSMYVTMKHSLTAQVSREDDSPAFSVKAGDKLLINASDDASWLYVSIPWIYQQDELFEGPCEGWVRLRGYSEILADGKWMDSWDLMNGLCMAD